MAAGGWRIALRSRTGFLAAKNARLVAVADVVAERATETAQRFETRAYFEPEELLSDPSVQAVYIATPPSSHAELAVMAARHGKHILCEKPMALDAAQCEEMVKACTDHGVQLGHATMMRFNACHKKMREMIVSGALGRPLVVHARYSVWWSSEVTDLPDSDEKVWELGDIRQTTWRRMKRIAGGGPMMDQGVHAIDTMVYLLGRVTEVGCFADTLTIKSDVEDTASVLLKFDNGVHGMLECYSSIPNFRGRRLLEVFGEKGSLKAEETLGPPLATLPNHRLFHYESSANGAYDAEPRPIACPADNAYEIQFSLFSEAVETGSPYPNSGEEALHVQRTLDAAFCSSSERRFISVE